MVEKADQTITVQDFIDMRDTDEITYYNYSILEYLNGYDMFITNLLYDYEDDLAAIAVTVTLNDKEKIKYKYNPGLLAYDVYGAVEAKFIIMMLNGIIDPKEFAFDKVKLIRTGDLRNFLGRIESVNEEFLATNKNKLKADFKANEGNTIWT